MPQITIGITGSLESIVDALCSAKENISVIKPNGTAIGYMTKPLATNSDGSTLFWFGIRREGEHFKFDVYEGQVFDVFGGDQLWFRFSTEQEVKAFLLGMLLGCTGQDFGLS